MGSYFVDKLKKQFIPIDYELDLFKNMQGLKQVGKSIQEYIEKFSRGLLERGMQKKTRRRLLVILVGCDLASRRN